MRPCLRFRAPAACYGCRDPLARLFNDIELLRRLSRDPSPHRTWRKHRETGDQGFLRRRYLDRDGSVEVQDGRTVVYRMILAKVTMLELTREPDTETGATMDPVQIEPGTQPMVDPVPRPQRTPNNPKTIPKPPPRKRKDADGLAVIPDLAPAKLPKSQSEPKSTNMNVRKVPQSRTRHLKIAAHLSQCPLRGSCSAASNCDAKVR